MNSDVTENLQAKLEEAYAKGKATGIELQKALAEAETGTDTFLGKLAANGHSFGIITAYSLTLIGTSGWIGWWLKGLL